MGATAVVYPKPGGEYEGAGVDADPDSGVRVGIIARGDADEAWRIAHERFPDDRMGQVTHQLAMKTSDSMWHKQLSEMAKEKLEENTPYWLGPFENYRTFCPYLVGSYERVAAEVARYIRVGYGTFILDIPANEEELGHIGRVFQRASDMVLS
jgi:alkanesulfonate monooxygenase